MNVLELHIIRNYPLSRLNRDENGSPKSFIFGGKPRASFSSQCFKRAVRMYLKDQKPHLFGGARTKYLIEHLRKALMDKGTKEPLALQLATAVGSYLSSVDESDETSIRTKTALFFSDMEIDGIASAIREAEQNETLDSLFKFTKGKKGQEDSYSLNKNKAKFLKGIKPKDIGDVALFGRMVSNDSSFSAEAASCFSHSFSVHASTNEPDFFSAVEESPLIESSGAAHVGESEHNSACYYSYININLDEVKSGLMSVFSPEEQEDIIREFINGCIIVTPSASKHGMFAATQPYCLLGLVRTGFELSLANAFEEPVRPSPTGYSEKAANRLKDEWDLHKKSFGSRLGIKYEKLWKMGDSLDDFIEGMLKNV